MHRLKVMLALLLLACCGVPFAGAAGVGTFSIEQTTGGVGVGQFGVATLYMDNTWAPPADSAVLTLSWDPAVIQYVSTDWQVGNTVAATPSGNNQLTLSFADYTNKYATGRVPIAAINFQGVAAGQSTMSISITSVRSHVGVSETDFTELTASSVSNPGIFTVGTGGGAVTTVPTVPGVTGTVAPTLTAAPNVTVTGNVTGVITTPITITTTVPTTGPTGITTGITTGVPFVPVQGSSGGSEDYTGAVTRTATVTATATATGTATVTATGTAGGNATPGATPTGGGTGGQTIMQIAQANPNLSTLVDAIDEAGLNTTLSGPGPFTVFAPTNAAFNALPAGTLNALLQDQAELTSVLTYHVASGRIMAADLTGRPSITTLQGSPVTVTVTGTRIRVDGANVTQADIQASNGVIHVIDAVMLPPSGNATATATMTGTAITTAPGGTTAVRTTVPVNTTATSAGADTLPLVAVSLLAALALIAARRR